MSTQKMMNPVWIVLVGVIIILFLSACDDKSTSKNLTDPDDIIIDTRMSSASDWTRFFKDLYKPMIICANHHTSAPAFIVDASLINDGRALITVRGADQTLFECRIKTNGKKPESWTAVNSKDFTGAVFKPEGAGLPLPDSCLENLQVKTKKGQSVGWLSYARAHCGS